MIAGRARAFVQPARWLLAGWLLGLVASARPEAGDAMRVGITLARPALAAPAPLPDIRWPDRAIPVVDTDAARFVVAPLSLAEGERFFLRSLPEQGFRLQFAASDAGTWRSRWRQDGSGRCLALEARAVLGSDLLRLRLADQPC